MPSFAWRADAKGGFVPVEFRDGRFYREWGRPQGWIDAASIVLDRSPTTASTFVVARHAAARNVPVTLISGAVDPAALALPADRPHKQVRRLAESGQ